MLHISVNVQQTHKPLIDSGCFITQQIKITECDKPLIASLADHRKQIRKTYLRTSACNFTADDRYWPPWQEYGSPADQQFAIRTNVVVYFAALLVVLWNFIHCLRVVLQCVDAVRIEYDPRGIAALTSSGDIIGLR